MEPCQTNKPVLYQRCAEALTIKYKVDNEIAYINVLNLSVYIIVWEEE